MRERCGVESDIFIAESDDGATSNIDVSSRCGDVVGAELGLDWSSFDSDPHSYSIAQTADEGVISAALTLLLPDMGAFAGVAESESLPAWLGAFAQTSDLEDDDPAAAFFWETVLDQVDTVRQTDSSDYLFRYVQNGVVQVGSLILSGEGTGANGLSEQPVELAAALVHEAGHGVAAGHVMCPFEIDGELKQQCDETPDGTLGAQAWWLWTWLRRYSGEIEHVHCLVVQGELDLVCARILTVDEFTPCKEADMCSGQ